MKYLAILMLVIAQLFSIPVSYAIGWWEETAVFRNKNSGEYKKAYKMLYRFDNKAFRDMLLKYVKNRDIPDGALLRDWDVVYYKSCERDVCTTRWSVMVDYQDLPDITSNDLLVQEIIRISATSEIFRLLIFIIGFSVIFVFWRQSGRKNALKKLKSIS